MSTIPNNLLNDLLDPLAQCFTPAVAKEVADLRLDDKVCERLADLEKKACEGTLTNDERAAFTSLRETVGAIAVLQAKTREYVQASTEELQGTQLSDRDRDLFLNMLDSPPAPNEALRAAAKRYSERRD